MYDIANIIEYHTYDSSLILGAHISKSEHCGFKVSMLRCTLVIRLGDMVKSYGYINYHIRYNHVHIARQVWHIIA